MLLLFESSIDWLGTTLVLLGWGLVDVHFLRSWILDHENYIRKRMHFRKKSFWTIQTGSSLTILPPPPPPPCLLQPPDIFPPL